MTIEDLAVKITAVILLPLVILALFFWLMKECIAAAIELIIAGAEEAQNMIGRFVGRFK